MSPRRYTITNFELPGWIRASLTDEQVERLEALATNKRFEATDEQLAAIQRSAEALLVARREGQVGTAVAFLRAVADAATDALRLLDPTVPAPAPASARPAKSLSDDARTAKNRANACWHYVDDRLPAEYARPGDLKAADPEAYRRLYEEGRALFDAGKLTTAGKPR